MKTSTRGNHPDRENVEPVFDVEAVSRSCRQDTPTMHNGKRWLENPDVTAFAAIRKQFATEI
jgi:hypothetical protein